MTYDQNQIESYVEAIAAHQPVIRAYILALVRHTAEIDDVLQETNLALWRKRDEYDPSRPFVGWACGIARLQVLAYFKRVKRTARPIDPALFGELCDEADRYAAQSDDRLIALRECLAELPPNQRKIIDMRYEAQRDVKGMAEELSQSANAVSSVLFRTRRSLSQCIERRMSEDEQ